MRSLILAIGVVFALPAFCTANQSIDEKFCEDADGDGVCDRDATPADSTGEIASSEESGDCPCGPDCPCAAAIAAPATHTYFVQHYHTRHRVLHGRGPLRATARAGAGIVRGAAKGGAALVRGTVRGAYNLVTWPVRRARCGKGVGVFPRARARRMARRGY